MPRLPLPVKRPQAGQQSAPHMHVLVCICSNVRQFHRCDGSTIKTVKRGLGASWGIFSWENFAFQEDVEMFPRVSAV